MIIQLWISNSLFAKKRSNTHISVISIINTYTHNSYCKTFSSNLKNSVLFETMELISATEQKISTTLLKKQEIMGMFTDIIYNLHFQHAASKTFIQSYKRAYVDKIEELNRKIDSLSLQSMLRIKLSFEKLVLSKHSLRHKQKFL